MSSKDTKRPANPRKDRLGAALRENLKRRKAQARGRAEGDPAGESGGADEAGPHEAKGAAGGAAAEPSGKTE